MDYEPLTKGDAHPSIVSIQEAETYLHDIIDDVSTTISRFPALLSMMLYDWGLLYIIIYIYIYSMRMDI